MAQRFFQSTIAIVYDFDGTLSPQPMQEYTVLPKIGIEPRAFWAKVDRDARDTESDRMLVYMRHILEELEKGRIDVKREDFAAMASRIKYFPGVTTWFARMNQYVRRKGHGGVKLRHYLVSAGRRRSSTAPRSAGTSSASTPRSTTSTTTAWPRSPSCSSPTR
jgi:hypothetical protein